MHAAQPGLAFLDLGVAIAQVHVTRTERLDLRAGQADAGLEALLDRVVVARLAVVGELDIAALLVGRRRRAAGAFAHSESVVRGIKKSGGISAAALVCRVTKDPARLVRHHLSWFHTKGLK